MSSSRPQEHEDTTSLSRSSDSGSDTQDDASEFAVYVVRVLNSSDDEEEDTTSLSGDK